MMGEKSNASGGSRWDGRCPYCGQPVNLYGAHESADYDNEFTFDCDHCEERIECTVHLVPEFELRKQAEAVECQPRLIAVDVSPIERIRKIQNG
jgi:hypothetical protein